MTPAPPREPVPPPPPSPDAHHRTVRLLQWALAAALGALGALGAVLWLQPPQAPLPPPQRAEAAVASAGGLQADAGPTGDAHDLDLSTPPSLPPEAPTASQAPSSGQVRSGGEPPPDAPPVRIVAEPAELRVWANTSVRLRAEVDEGEAFDRFVWHFEDGSEPVAGVEVEHVFAESVRDRHVTLEAHRAPPPGAKAEAPLVVSRRLPVERLEVVPVDGQLDAPAGLPRSRGTRVVLLGGTVPPEHARPMAKVIARLDAEVVVVAGERSAADALSQAVEIEAPKAAVVHWPASVDETAAVVGASLQVLRDPGQAVQQVGKGERDLGVLAVGDVALTAADTRGETLAEAELRRVRDALQAAAAYRTSLLLTARPLTVLRDGELIADRAYRLYEYALRHQASAVVSAASGVYYDGRFGGVTVVGVGSAEPAGCLRLAGHDQCQAGSLTVIDVGERGRLQVSHLLAPGFEARAGRAELPAEVGKVRR